MLIAETLCMEKVSEVLRVSRWEVYIPWIYLKRRSASTFSKVRWNIEPSTPEPIISLSGSKTPGRGFCACHGGRRDPPRRREIEDVTSVSKRVVKEPVFRLSEFDVSNCLYYMSFGVVLGGCHNPTIPYSLSDAINKFSSGE